MNRRGFIQLGAASVGSLALRPFGLLPALAQNGPNYRALVCVFLFGGNDSNNSIIPSDDANFEAYTSIRGILALGSADVTQVTSVAGAPYAFHSKLAEMASLFTSRELAVVANTGSLVQPLTRAQYQAQKGAIPSNLFSHSDQQLQWQTSVAQGNSPTGWAGRAADYIAAQKINSSSFPTFLSVAGNILEGAGANTEEVALAPGKSLQLTGFNSSAPSQAIFTSLKNLLTLDTGVSLVQAANGILGDTISDASALANALATATPLKTTFPTTSIGQQLQQVAQIIQAQSALGMQRQIFFCSLGGFDTHTNQIATHNPALSPAQPGNRGLLQRHAGTRDGGERHHVHRIGLQPHVPADVGRRQRSRVGRPSHGAGRARCRGGTEFTASSPRLRWAVRTTRIPAGDGFRRLQSTSTARRCVPGLAFPTARVPASFPLSPISARRRLAFSGSDLNLPRDLRRLEARPCKSTTTAFSGRFRMDASPAPPVLFFSEPCSMKSCRNKA